MRLKNFFATKVSIYKNQFSGLPSYIWTLDFYSIQRFFAAIISCDGNIYIHKNGFSIEGREVPPGLEVTLSCGRSYEYAWDMYWLLRKYGILSQIPYLERGSNWKIKIGKGWAIKNY